MACKNPAAAISSSSPFGIRLNLDYLWRNTLVKQKLKVVCGQLLVVSVWTDRHVCSTASAACLCFRVDETSADAEVT